MLERVARPVLFRRYLLRRALTIVTDYKSDFSIPACTEEASRQNFGPCLEFKSTVATA
jgi:hypothetical protein